MDEIEAMEFILDKMKATKTHGGDLPACHETDHFYSYSWSK
jgi:hypothetical protein